MRPNSYRCCLDTSDNAILAGITSCVHICQYVWFGMFAVDMWRPLGCADNERFALVWESEELKALNNTLFSFVKNKVGHSLLQSAPSQLRVK